MVQGHAKALMESQQGAWRLVLGPIFSILSSTFFNVLLDDFVYWVSLLRYSQEQGVSYCIWAGLFLELEISPTSDSDAEKFRGICVLCLKPVWRATCERHRI